MLEVVETATCDFWTWSRAAPSRLSRPGSPNVRRPGATGSRPSPWTASRASRPPPAKSFPMPWRSWTRFMWCAWRVTRSTSADAGSSRALHGYRGRKDDPLLIAAHVAHRRRPPHRQAEGPTRRALRDRRPRRGRGHLGCLPTDDRVLPRTRPDRGTPSSSEKLIASLSRGVPLALTEVATLKKRAADVLAYFDRPGTSNGPTEAINGRLGHLRGSALGFRNLTNRIARSLLETGSLRRPTPCIGMSPITAGQRYPRAAGVGGVQPLVRRPGLQPAAQAFRDDLDGSRCVDPARAIYQICPSPVPHPPR